MPLVAVSKDTIRAYVIRYFHEEFGDPISWFKGSTNVRKAYKYKAEQWIEVGPTLSGLPWMRRLEVKLLSTDMPPLSTIDDLTDAILSKLQQVMIVSRQVPAFRASTIEVLGSPKRRSPQTRKRKSKPLGTPKGQRAKAKRPKKTITNRTKKSRR